MEDVDGRSNQLGEYLRARRALVSPAQAGIPDTGSRRVRGLRREEVALLAGISAEYYLRLERGRDRNPSRQVLEALARVLVLDDHDRAHLLGLVAGRARPVRSRPASDVVPLGTAELVAGLAQPAYVESRWFDILVANRLATALSPRFTAGANQLLDMFLDPAERALYPAWEDTTACYAATLRRDTGTDVGDPRFVELVDRLSAASARFAELWARHDVTVQRPDGLRIDHPEVGELILRRERFDVSGHDGMHLIVLHAPTGSVAAEKLALLASATADQLPPSHR